MKKIFLSLLSAALLSAFCLPAGAREIGRYCRFSQYNYDNAPQWQIDAMERGCMAAFDADYMPMQGDFYEYGYQAGLAMLKL